MPCFFSWFCLVYTSIDRGSTGSRGPIDPPTFSVGSKNTFWHPLLMCTKHVYCRVYCHYHAPSTPFTPSITYTKLTRLCLTIPVSSATAERSLSALRTVQLKTFTRSTMNASRLAHLALLHFHQDRTDTMDLKDLRQTFLNSRPKERWQIDGIILRRAGVQNNCMWIV